MKKKKLPITDASTPRKNPVRIVLLLLLNTIIAVSVYQVAVYYEFATVIMWIYLIAASVLLAAFIILNRGISNKGTLPEELPADWSAAKKQEYLDCERHNRKIAKTLMFFILPILIAFFIDIINLFYLEKLKSTIEALFGGNT